MAHTGHAELLSRIRELEKCLKESGEAAEKLVVQGMREGALTLTPRGTILYANRQFSAMVSAPAERVVGGEFQEFVVESDRDAFEALLSDAGRGEITLQAENGSLVPVSLSVGGATAEDGRGIPVIVTDLQERRPCEEVLRAEQLARSILDQAAEAIVVVDRAGKIVHATRVAHRLAGANVLFRDFEDVFPLFTASGLVSAMPIADRRSRMLEGMEASFLRNGADVRQVAVTAGPVRGANREILGDVVTLIDITERKRSEARMRASLLEKEALLKEVHHRVKNNLQVITSMLNLQAKAVKDPKALQILDESRSRIRSIALIHETLCESTDLTKVDMAPYLRSLAGALARTYGDGTPRIALKVECGAVLLDVGQALPCGLLVNELITNALRHAFPGGRQGEILIGLSEQGGHLALLVADNGIGLPEGVGVHGAETLGLQLVGTFAEQLSGKIEMVGPPGAGFRIKFPAAPAQAH